MSGHMKIRLDYCDAQKAIITLDSKEDQGNTRTGATLQIDVGREAVVKLPEFLQESGEVNADADNEPTDQIIERQGAQIKTQQALQQAALVPADETDHHRMQELMNALHNERETTRALQEVSQLVQSEFSKNLDAAGVDELTEIEQRHGVSSTENPEDKRNALHTKFNNSSISEQVDLFKSSKNALDEQQKREAAKNFTAGQSNLDRDARYTGDSYRGPDSTTDNNDVSQSHEEEREAQEHFEEDGDVEAESNNPQQEEKAGYPGSSVGGGTTSQSKLEDRAVKMEDPDAESDEDLSTDSSTGDNKTEDQDESHKETQQKADEALSEAKKAENAASLSKNAAESSKEAVDENESSDDDFKSRVNKMKVAQLSEVEEKHDLDGEGNSKARKDALKEAYDNASDEEKEELSNDVDEALED